MLTNKKLIKLTFHYGYFDQFFIGQYNQVLLVKTTIKNWFAQVHPNNQFFLVILTNLFLQCTDPVVIDILYNKKKNILPVLKASNKKIKFSAKDP